MYEVVFSAGVEKDLKKIRAYDRKIILAAVAEQLAHSPAVPTRNRKLLVNLIPSFEVTPPIWELRIGNYRVFYDLDEERRKVCVRAVRKKPAHQTAEEIS